MNGLLSPLGDYIKNNLTLTLILAAILLIVLVLIVLLIVEIVKAKKKKRQQAEEAQSAPEPQPEMPPESAPAEEQKPAAASDPKLAGYVFVPVEPKKEEKKPAERKKPAPKPAKDETPAAAAVAAKKPESAGANGKWSVYEDGGRFGFRLIASNGEVMLESSTTYASLSGAKSGIKTYQSNIAAGRLEVKETKNGFRVQILNANGGLHAASADYKTRSNCESACESIKRWAASAVVVIENEEPEEK